MKKDLLYVMYMGGPDSIGGIEEFLYNLFSDRTIIDFHIGGFLQKIIAKKIAKKRSVKVAPEYMKIGGRSPQLPHLESLLEKLKPLYHERTGRELKTSIGMCYYRPYIENSLKELEHEEFDNIIVTTMYPQYSYTTSGVCFSRFEKAQKLKGDIRQIPFWHMNKSYNECLIRRISEAAERLGKPLSECHIQFSAHSLPQYTVKKGDEYTLHIKQQAEYLISMTKPNSWGLSFQSRTGPVKWVSPFTDRELERLASEKTDNIIVVPISFVSDHIETLIELDEQYIPLARSKGVNITRTESLNSSDDFAESLFNIITS